MKTLVELCENIKKIRLNNQRLENSLKGTNFITSRGIRNLVDKQPFLTKVTSYVGIGNIINGGHSFTSDDLENYYESIRFTALYQGG